MGANATTSVPSYVAGEVLTAADLNITNSGIPVFANSTDRTNGFGGTGEKVLAEGQYAYLESDDKTYVYDGSAWKEVGSAGLVLISSTTIGSAVSTVTVSSAFSSTYDNYKIIIGGGVATVADVSLRLQIGSSTSGYYTAGFFTGGSWGASVNAQRQTNAAFFEGGIASTNALSADIELRSPNLAKITEMFTRANSTTTTGYTSYYAGYLNDTTQHTAFTITVGSGTLTGGTIRVYGYVNS